MLAALSVICVGLIYLLQTKDTNFNLPDSSQYQQGKLAPDFSLPNLNGTIVSLSDYKDKVVLLNIWATWCPSCVEEMPSMEKLYQKLNGEGFEILAVSIDALGAEVVRPFMKKNSLNFPALIDPKGTIRSLYLTIGIPESIIIDKEGFIVDKVIGPRDWDSAAIIRYFQDLIRKK
jgi:peroxiredoxin